MQRSRNMHPIVVGGKQRILWLLVEVIEGHQPFEGFCRSGALHAGQNFFRIIFLSLLSYSPDTLCS